MRIAAGPVVIDRSESDFLTIGSKFTAGDGYWMVQVPTGADLGEWFGADHYIEINDQAGGQYGGVEAIEIAKDSLVLTLSGSTDVFKEPLHLSFSEPMTAEVVDTLSRIGSKR